MNLITLRRRQFVVTLLLMALVLAMAGSGIARPLVYVRGAEAALLDEVVVIAEPSQLSGISFFDDFNGGVLDQTFWTISDKGAPGTIRRHQGFFQPNRVWVDGEYLVIKLTQEKKAGSVISRGGEISTKQTYHYGTYEWRVRFTSTAITPLSSEGNNVSGNVGAGFIYVNNSETEIDFEVQGQYPDQLGMSSWLNSDTSQDPTWPDDLENSSVVATGLSADFRTYKFVWAQDSIEYYMDGVLLATHTTHVPSAPAYFMVNHWGTNSSNFGGVATIGVDRYLYVDWVRYTEPSSAPNDPPTANPGGLYNGTEDVVINFNGSGSSDPDNDPLTYVWDFGDGSTGSGATTSHTYLWGDTFTVTLIVSDGKGGADTATTTANVTEVNDAPVADPNGPYSGAVGSAIAFDGAGSSDFDNLDGTTANDQSLSYTWSFGDEGTANGTTPTHTYAVASTYTVTLVVSDGIVDSTPGDTTATISEPSSITLSATRYKVKGLQKADLVWSGATSANVDVYRDGSIITTTPNNGFYTDNIDQRGGGSYTYKVCQEGPSTCSNEATVTF